MYIADLPWQAWLGFALFVPSILWALIGNLSLTGKLKQRGVQIPFHLQGMTLFMYPKYRPRKNAEQMDRLAVSVLLAVVVLLATVFFLGRFMWPDSAWAH